MSLRSPTRDPEAGSHWLPASIAAPHLRPGLYGDCFTAGAQPHFSEGREGSASVHLEAWRTGVGCGAPQTRRGLGSASRAKSPSHPLSSAVKVPGTLRRVAPAAQLNYNSQSPLHIAPQLLTPLPRGPRAAPSSTPAEPSRFRTADARGSHLASCPSMQAFCTQPCTEGPSPWGTVS